MDDGAEAREAEGVREGLQAALAVGEQRVELDAGGRHNLPLALHPQKRKAPRCERTRLEYAPRAEGLGV